MSANDQSVRRYQKALAKRGPSTQEPRLVPQLNGESVKKETMRKSRFTEEQIIAILTEQDCGMGTTEVCRKRGVSNATFDDWKARFGWMDMSDARGLTHRGDPSHLPDSEASETPGSGGPLMALKSSGVEALGNGGPGSALNSDY